ncbi:hypothetical protein NB706_002827 [Xanthomonas sacchari]|nr:hypothetical protein [Xanthomonas sacchari]
MDPFAQAQGTPPGTLNPRDVAKSKRLLERPNPIDYRSTRFDKDWASDGTLGDVAVQGIDRAIKQLLPKNTHQSAVARPPPDVRFNPALHERASDLGSEATGDAYKAAPIAFEKAPGLDGEASRRIRQALADLQQRRGACPAAQRARLLAPVQQRINCCRARPTAPTTWRGARCGTPIRSWRRVRRRWACRSEDACNGRRCLNREERRPRAIRPWQQSGLKSFQQCAQTVCCTFL